MNSVAEDIAQIDLTEDWQVRLWTGALGISKEELRKAVQAVGNSVEKVREHLMSRQ